MPEGASSEFRDVPGEREELEGQILVDRVGIRFEISRSDYEALTGPGRNGRPLEEIIRQALATYIFFRKERQAGVEIVLKRRGHPDRTLELLD